MVSFTGRCLVHRAEIMQLHGAWPEALDEAQRAGQRFAQALNQVAAGEASYRQGEIHRLRGELVAAEEAYREASRCGWEPQPGLALLRLAQGDERCRCRRHPPGGGRDHRAACSVPGCCPPTSRSCWRWATRRRPAAPAASSRRSRRVSRAACWARWSRTRAERSHWPKVTPGPPWSRSATRASVWQELGAPYECARARVLVGLACRALGDEDTAALELAARPGCVRAGSGRRRTSPASTRSSLARRRRAVHGLTRA